MSQWDQLQGRLKVITDVATNFDDAARVPFVSEKHSEASYKHDLKLIVEELPTDRKFFSTNQKGIMHPSVN